MLVLFTGYVTRCDRTRSAHTQLGRQETKDPISEPRPLVDRALNVLVGNDSEQKERNERVGEHADRSR